MGKSQQMAMPRAEEGTLKQQAREWMRSLLWAFVLFAVIRSLAFQAFRIPSPSMEDTLLVHDFLFISKLTYGPNIPFTHTRLPGLRQPRVGDVIVFQNPKNPKQDYIKRCVAVGGQTVEYKNKVLYVDGVRRDEPYVKHIDPTLRPYRDNFGPYRVPKGNIFMMGDNRDNSEDSRFWGPLDVRLIRGKAEVIYFSWDAKKHLPRFNRMLRLIH
ncbi:MAG: signal peptidase I [Candidatus Eisenbacteria bacterium]|nr:signal peptidase I [Candidatus Eisenbacteria bacterium]